MPFEAKKNINISGGEKQPTHFMIEQIQYGCTDQAGNKQISEIMRRIQLIKPLLTEKGKAHRKRLCGWTMERMKPKISRPMGSDPYHFDIHHHIFNSQSCHGL